MKQTTLITPKAVKKDWYVVDATGQTVGRLASQVALVLRGKHKPNFTPHINNGDHVIILNAEKVIFSGKKETDKNYYHHSLYPGGLTAKNVETVRENQPEYLLEHAIRLMLPKTSQGANQFRALHVIVGPEHPYAAQKPKELVIQTRKGGTK